MEEAKKVILPGTTLCGFLAHGTLGACDDPSTFKNKLNKKCDINGCGDPCTDDCNAWSIGGMFSAHAVDINDWDPVVE